jgi:hypothetical protein
VRLQAQEVGLNRAESMFMRGQYVEQPKLPRWSWLRGSRRGGRGWPGCGQKLGLQMGGDYSTLDSN